MKKFANICIVLLLTCLVPIRAEDKDKTDWSCWLGDGAAAVVGGVGAVAAAPFALATAGFTAGGVAASSLAAGFQSIVYGGAAGGLFSVLQAAGAAGIGAMGKAAVFATGALVGTAVKKQAAPCAEGPECVKDKK